MNTSYALTPQTGHFHLLTDDFALTDEHMKLYISNGW